jgi:signal transduction histidine kinase/CheY-like chemotaxis protein
MVGSAKAVRIRAVLVSAALALVVCANLPAVDSPLTLQEAASRKAPEFTPVYEGRIVVVSGQVSARAVHIVNFFHMAIQDRNRGLILETTGSQFDRFAPGDWVEAHGRIVERWGLPVVSVSKITIVSTGAPPVPEPVDPLQAQSLARVGQLIVTEGPVVETGSNFGGAYLRMGVFPVSLKVFLPNTAGGHANLSAFPPGEIVRVTGIAYQYCPNPPYSDQFELLIGDSKDVTRVGRGWISQIRALWPVLAVLFAMGYLWRRSENASRRQREMLRTIYALGEEVLTAAASQEIQQKISEVLPRVLAVTGARLYLYDRGAKMLNPVGESVASGVPLEFPSGLLQTGAATCFQSRALLAIPDTRRHPFRAVAGEQPSSALPRSVLFIPMLAQGEPVGVFQVHHNKRARTFSRDEEAVAQHLANQMGLAVKLLQQRSFREQLSRSEKLAAVGRLISGVVNDLQTPLEAISSMADSALAEYKGSAPGHELLVIASEARRAAAIVTRLISFAQPEQAQAEPVELDLMLRNLIQFREREWKACGIHLTNMTKGKALWVLGSQGQLEQVFLNLFVHAEQSLEEAGDKRIVVRADKMAGRVFVEIGYSAPLRQSAGVSPSSDAGALGLDICRSIVAGHGGELRLSAPDGESLFEIELPSIPLDQLAPEPTEAGQAPTPRRWTALLLEQEEFVERTLIEWLSNRGYRVVPVRSSEEGLDLVQRLRFDVVFCSTHLRGLNWVEFFDRVRGRVGAFTLLAEAFSQDLSTHFRGEGRYVLHKPIEQSQFDRTLAAVEGRLASSVEARAPEVESY